MKIGPRKWLTTLASLMEILISAIVLIAVVVAAIDLVTELGILEGNLLSPENFDTFLAHALSLVIGVEFIKMLIKHTPGAAIEVLMYAIARQLIVEHTTTFETLVGILAIASVFAIRKFLFIRSFDETERHVFPADKKIRRVNLLTMVNIPGPSDSTVGEVLRKQLEVRGEEVVEGAKVTFHNASLRVAEMKDGKIEMVEVLPMREM